MLSSRRSAQLALFCCVSAGLSLALMLTSWAAPSRLGAPPFWPWALTGLQVLALWAAGRRISWSWLLGAAVQPPWIAYAIVTGQLGFVAGCALSAVVQVSSFLRRPQSVESAEEPEPTSESRDRLPYSA